MKKVVWGCLLFTAAFLISGCGCLLPDVPYVPGVYKSFSRGTKEVKKIGFTTR